VDCWAEESPDAADCVVAAGFSSWADVEEEVMAINTTTKSVPKSFGPPKANSRLLAGGIALSYSVSYEPSVSRC